MKARIINALYKGIVKAIGKLLAKMTFKAVFA